MCDTGKIICDLDNPLTYSVIDNVFKEYLQGPKPVFMGKEVHIGTDEYDKEGSGEIQDVYGSLYQAGGKLWQAGADVGIAHPCKG